jgi:mono/diheme cytochrome c family protein
MRIEWHQLQRILHQRLAASITVAGGAVCILALGAVPHPVQASSKQAQATGAAVFSSKGCQHCHGTDATGTDRGPDLSSVGKKWHKEQIEKQIREGGNGMPAFGDVLQPDEIKSLVDFLGAKRKPISKSRKKSVEPLPTQAKPSNEDSGI